MPSEHLRTRLDTLELWEDALLFGHSQLRVPGALKRHHALDNLNFGNVCDVITYAGAASETVWTIPDGPDRHCSAVANGVFTKGLKAGFTLYIDIARSLREQLLTVSTDNNVTRVHNVLVSEQMQTLTLLERTWLSHALHVEAELYLQAQVDHLQQLLHIRSIMLGVFLALLVVCYLVVYDPLVVAMDAHLKTVRGLLVVVPAEVAQTTPSMRKLLMTTADR